MDEFRFRCTECGKCCVAAPEMTILEGLSLYRDFVLMLRIGGVADVDRLPIDAQRRCLEAGITVRSMRDQYLHMASLGAIEVSADGVRVAIRASATALAPLSLGRCPQRAESGACAIRDRRPAMCRARPVDFWIGHLDQPSRFAAMKRLIADAGYDCDLGEGAPAIWRDGAIVGPEQLAAWDDGVRSSRQEWPVLSILRSEMQAGSPSLPSVTQVAAAALAGDAYYADFLGTISSLWAVQASGSADRLGLDLSSVPDPETFLAAQLGLVREQLAAALRHKSKADRPVTEKLRAMERHYAAALAERPWEIAAAGEAAAE